MSFLLWSNNIRMEEIIMTDTALRAGAQSANITHMVFANEEHEKFTMIDWNRQGIKNHYPKVQR